MELSQAFQRRKRLKSSERNWYKNGKRSRQGCRALLCDQWSLLFIVSPTQPIEKILGLVLSSCRRNSFEVKPPALTPSDVHWPGRERKYFDLEMNQIPLTESLQDCMGRTEPVWRNKIMMELQSGRNVMVVAHANTLRGLIKIIDGKYKQGRKHNTIENQKEREVATLHTVCSQHSSPKQFIIPIPISHGTILAGISDEDIQGKEKQSRRWSMVYQSISPLCGLDGTHVRSSFSVCWNFSNPINQQRSPSLPVFPSFTSSTTR